MGWICRQCGSENRYVSGRCAACLKRAGLGYRLDQRMQQRRLRRLGDASVNDYLDRQIVKEKKSLKRQERWFRVIMVLLALAAVVLLGSVVLHVSTAGGLEVRMNPRWEVRLDQLIRRNF